MGISGDAALPRQPPPHRWRWPPPTLINPAAISCRRVTPSAASAGLSGEPVASSRVAAWPAMSSAASARTRANSASAIASGRIAFWTEVAWVPTSAASVRSPAAGNWRVRDCARCISAWGGAVASVTYAPLKPTYCGPSSWNSAGLAKMAGTLSHSVTGKQIRG